MSKPEFIEAHDRTGWPDENLLHAESCIPAVIKVAAGQVAIALVVIAILAGFALNQ